jgi:predicted CoA-binding protein
MNHDRFDALVQEFLSQKRIAIWGVEDAAGDPGKFLVSRLRQRGADVISVNPAFEDEPLSHRASSLTRVSPPVNAVLVYVDRPQTMAAVDDCLAAEVPLVWLHDSFSAGAATTEAIDKLRAAGRVVIPGLCPMLFIKPVDAAHFCLKWMLKMTGKVGRVQRATQ